MIPPLDPGEVPAVLRGVLGCLRADGNRPSAVQLDTLQALAALAFGTPLDPATESGLAPDELAAALTDPAARRLAVHLMVVMEFVESGLTATLADSARTYARALGVHEPLLRAAHDLAAHHLIGMYSDVQRHSWYTHETARRVLGGRGLEILRSKIAAVGGPTNEHEARRWRALGEQPPGTWGRAVHDFYGAHGFAFPGERHSIRVVGAEHDWIHVLADYDTSPEGEIDVFTFIAASKGDEEGLAMLASTLGLFQNGTIHHIAGTRIPIARQGTLGVAGAPQRLADAFRRGRATTSDVIGLDHFAWAAAPLAEARERLSVPAKEAG